MSALHSIADIHCGNRNVCFVPIVLQKSAIMSAWADAKGFAAIGYYHSM
jgi:hypothetical protein